MTSLFILVFFALVMLAEGIFFERFYQNSKVNGLNQAVHEFQKQYNEVSNDSTARSRLLVQLMNDHHASAVLLDRQLRQVALDPFFITLKTSSGPVTLRFPANGTTLSQIPDHLEQGKSLTADGIFMDQQNRVMQVTELEPQTSTPVDGETRIKGTVTELAIPRQLAFDPFYQYTLVDKAISYMQEQSYPYIQRLEAGENVELNWQDDWSGGRYVLMIGPLAHDKGTGRYIAVMTSMQPVNEAVVIVQRYFVFLAPVIVLLVLLLSLVYSRMISRPLIRLSQTATRMARLDFRGPAALDSRNEFGQLSRSLDTLAHNLDHTLNQLQASNNALQTEVNAREHSEQLRKELVGNISHELKTPLGIVKGFAEGLQDEVAADKKERYLQLIINETDRMNALIIDMLELSRYEVQAIKLQPQVIRLDRLLAKLIPAFTTQMESKQLHVQINGKQDVLLWADARRLEQVWINLLSNAIRHARANTTIYIRTHQISTSDLRIAIENKGNPIPAPDLDRLWDKFYRNDRAEERQSRSTGLGLAIVKHILELHNSQYGVRNTEDGVEFYYTLPLIQQEETENNEENDPYTDLA
ncbi:sensor histidine kinase [Paenibacillus bovis]|uniref:sensor histidine kinase n=1 Tax=Paenibacillus bovis TaxID=1616788 RepID=UPI001314B736|nr:HAMP domain-containing sensor histidine kinase [Paenibacillus bovis]